MEKEGADRIRMGHGEPNVGHRERLASLAAGAGLAAYGLSRRTLPGLLMAAIGGVLTHRAVTGRCPAYRALGLTTAHGRSAMPRDFFNRGVHVEETVTVERPARELYRFWRNFKNLPRFMRHLSSVAERDGRTSHWVARGPAGRAVSWDAQIINDREGELIAWKSLRGSPVHNTGSVRFVPAANGRTHVKVRIEYLPPAGAIGKVIARMLGRAPDQKVREDLRRFKELMEGVGGGGGAPGRQAMKKRSRRGKSRVATTGRAAARVAARAAGRAARGARDAVQEASEESFPASDAPGWRSRARRAGHSGKSESRAR